MGKSYLFTIDHRKKQRSIHRFKTVHPYRMDALVGLLQGIDRKSPGGLLRGDEALIDNA
jgi:hypothetical protein